MALLLHRDATRGGVPEQPAGMGSGKSNGDSVPQGWQPLGGRGSGVAGG